MGLMTIESQETGQKGEHVAQAILRSKGFRIEATNWRPRNIKRARIGEIDLIAYHPHEKVLAFTEVKTRKSLMFGAPEEAVDFRKQEQILALAQLWLDQHPPAQDTAIRFDVISIYYPPRGRAAEIQHIENAFSAF